MCGILALYSPSTTTDDRLNRLRDLTRTIKHRGPDHQGEWLDDKCPLGLAQRRLAIVDLTADGRQPMVSSSGRYIISFNGEIYNFLVLREELLQQGAVFKGRSDTEVILAGVEKWGLNTTLQKINGMFAIILWDRERQQLHLIRDRLGKKPLYFGWAGGDFLCASELRPFMAHPDFARTLSGAAVAQYMHLGFIPAPYSIFESVAMLLPGCRMMIEPAKLSAGQDLRHTMDAYWNPARVAEDAMSRRAQTSRLSYTDRVNQTEALIETCVRDRMIADVPLGAFLSGGIDSSLVVALMQRNSDAPVKTYSIGFEEGAYNEAHHARAVATHLGTDHHEQILTARDALNIVPDLPRIADEPLADASIIPTWLVSKFARSEVTVALSGDGGDEMFGGYHRHVQIPRIVAAIGWLPAPVRAAIASTLRALPAGMLTTLNPKHPQFADRIQKLATMVTRVTLPEIYETVAGYGENNAITRTPRPLVGYPFRMTSWWPQGVNVTEWLIYADTIHYLPNDVLTKVDRATMAVSLESRAPLLDTRLFAHAWSLPFSDRITGGQGKHILRDILYRHVPRELIDRPKQGFSVPVGDWLRGPLRDWAHALLHNPSLYQRFGIAATDVQELWATHLAGRNGAAQTLWRLCVLQAWAEHYLDGKK